MYKILLEYFSQSFITFFQTPVQRLVRRMTRFFVKTDPEETMSIMMTLLHKAGYTVKKTSPGQVVEIRFGAEFIGLS